MKQQDPLIVTVAVSDVVIKGLWDSGFLTFGPTSETHTTTAILALVEAALAAGIRAPEKLSAAPPPVS
jgi:hypothetical protein